MIINITTGDNLKINLRLLRKIITITNINI